MTGSIQPARLVEELPRRATRRDRWAREMLLGRIARLGWGRVTLRDGEASDQAGHDQGPDVTVTVHCPRFYSQIAFGGSIGAAEAYMSGMWDCDDLPGLVRILARNTDVLGRLEGGAAWLVRPARKLLHWMNRNTLAGSKANIEAHYDLGNAFYELFLDETMTYSCGIFERPEASLADAQRAKIDRLCRDLRLSEANHLLEIGTGWGALAIHAARRYGCRVTTTTISNEQHDRAASLIEREGLRDRIELLKRDYRQLTGTFDRIVSVEMIEAVGHRNVPEYFARLDSLGSDDALVALQAITVPDQHYKTHVRRVDFIKRYIFPGSCLTSVWAMCDAARRRTRLRPVKLTDLTPHYARTLELWRLRLGDNWDKARELGLSEPFLRMWEYYLAYCQGAFAERYIGDVQLVLAGPDCRVESVAPEATEA